MRKLGVALTLTLAGLALAVSVARPASADGTLLASVGPGFTITLTQNGVPVKNLQPGSYTISVDDKSTLHNVHLSGPGVDQATDIETTGTTTWTVTFQDGTYFFDCDAHSSQMFGKFTVGTVAPTTTTTPTPTATPLLVHATAVAGGHTILVKGTANKAAKWSITLWRGTKKVASATHSAAKAASLRYTKATAGKYVAKVAATAGGTTVRRTVKITLKAM